ncbi:MAG: hypothetical protein AAFU79_02650 [Myxococcota bacterium]
MERPADPPSSNALSKLEKRLNQTFVLVCLVCALFAAVCLSIGFVVWQAIMLVDRLDEELDGIDQQMVALELQLEELSLENDLSGTVDRISTELDASFREAIHGSELSGAVDELSLRLNEAQLLLAETATTVHTMRAGLEGIDPERVADRALSHLLRNMGEAFLGAAKAVEPRPRE